MKKFFAMVAMMAMTLAANAQGNEEQSPWADGLDVKIAAEAGKFTLTADGQDPLTIAINKQTRSKKGDIVLLLDGKQLTYAIVKDAANPQKPKVVLLNREYEDNENGTPKVETTELEPGTFNVVKAGVMAPGARIAAKSSNGKWLFGKMVAEKDGNVLVLLNGSWPKVQSYKKADVKMLPLKENLKAGDEVLMNRAKFAALTMSGYKVKKVDAALGRVWITFEASGSLKIMSIVDVTKAVK